MTFTCAEPGAGSFVDCVAEVVAASLNGVALAPAEGGRIALTDLRADNVLTVETVQADTSEGEGVHQVRRPGRRRGLPLDVVRAGRGAGGLRVLRPARPQGPAPVHGHGPGRVDRGQQLR